MRMRSWDQDSKADRTLHRKRTKLDRKTSAERKHESRKTGRSPGRGKKTKLGHRDDALDHIAGT